MNNNENALTWFGILSAIVGILTTIFGLIFPFVSEIMRRRNYEKLAKNFDQQKVVYSKLLRDMNSQTHETRGLIVLSWGERMIKEYLDKKLVSSAELAIKRLAEAAHCFTTATSEGNLGVAVSLLLVMDKILAENEETKKKVQKQLLEKKWRWPIPLECIKKALKTVRLEEGNLEEFIRIYNEYGLPSGR